MNYVKESDGQLSALADCYWEAALPDGDNSISYPSLPEPYVNLYFSLGSGREALIKGISETASRFDMTSDLFGVRLTLNGFLQLQVGKPETITDRIVLFSRIGGTVEVDLEKAVNESNSFHERVTCVQQYLREKRERVLPEKEAQLVNAYQFLNDHFNDPKVIQKYAGATGVSPRTISRWFTSEIGIAPKRLARIARFHRALASLHERKELRFYLDCGYFDQAHFIREFKEFTNLTPES